MADEYEIKDNSGSLFRVMEKASDRHPDFTGKGKVNGQLLYVSGWLKESKSGKKYLSLAFSEPREKGELRPAEASKPSGGKSFADMKDDVPF